MGRYPTFTELEAEVERCHERLEITHHYVFGQGEDELVRVDVPYTERDKDIDGIFCRDATIHELERQITDLKRALDTARRTNQNLHRRAQAAEAFRERFSAELRGWQEYWSLPHKNQPDFAKGALRAVKCLFYTLWSKPEFNAALKIEDVYPTGKQN